MVLVAISACATWRRKDDRHSTITRNRDLYSINALYELFQLSNITEWDLAGNGVLPSRVSLHSTEKLDQRPQRPGLLRFGIPPVLSVQPFRGCLGTHVLGPRCEPQSCVVEAASGGTSRRERDHDLQRIGRGRLEEHERIRQGWHPSARRHLHRSSSGTAEPEYCLQHGLRSHLGEIC